MSFGGIEPGDYRKILIYNKDRVFAFGITFGFVNDEWYANGAGCINYGFPIITDTPTPQILPTGICTYEHVVSNVPHESIVARAIEVRGLKVTVSKVPVPVSYGPAFEGERVRGDDIYLEAGGGRTPAVELVVSADMNAVTDGKIEVVGPEITDVGPGSQLPMAIYVEVAGRQMQSDFEPILERQIHHLINYAQGVMHIGQRDIAWLRVSKQAVDKGFRMAHLGSILHAKLHQDFGKIFDKAQVTIYTDEAKVKRDTGKGARPLQAARRADRRHDRRGHRPLLLLPPVPVLRAEPRVRGDAGADRPLRRVQLARLQGLLRDQPDRPEPAGAQGRGARRAVRPLEGRGRLRGQGLARHGRRPWTPTASCATR